MTEVVVILIVGRGVSTITIGTSMGVGIVLLVAATRVIGKGLGLEIC